MIALVDLKRQFLSLRAEIMSEVEAVLSSGQYIMGSKVDQLEKKLSSYLGVPHVITVANGTDALVLTLKAYGIGKGDEVITTPFTFFASAEAVSLVGAVPVFVDIDRHTYNIDPTLIEAQITPATKAIIPVHIFGQPAAMDEIMGIAQKHNLIVVEDACQAFGAKYKGKPVGSLGHASCFSFFPTKNLGTIGDGGMIATYDSQLAETIKKLRQHGSSKKYYHEMIGYNSRLDEIHAAILGVLLERVDQWNDQRRELADRYREFLAEETSLLIQAESPDAPHIYHLFCLESGERDNYMDKLIQADIQTAVYYPIPLHLQEVYHSLGYQKGDFPVAEQVSERIFAIPMSPFLSKEEQDQVIAALRQEGGA
ncbi:DegT/DnrJ/EryC1/StrS family aminotransferase [Brevibacillus ginsengisoli]|uniref:DegT/DnrJ/EryC1/StrS family aminotransferase n=1 Tax=Brevibacillus ginsengisoli TaxID=363854 RepID=UPI003CEC553B